METVRHTMHKELASKKLKNDIRHLAGLLLILGAASATVLGQQRTYSGPQNIPQMMTTPTSSGFGSGAAGPIGAGDLLEMSVFDTPELSGKMRVSNTGDILVPLVGSLHVAGMKAEEAQNLIRQKFIDGGFLKDPQVSVFVAEYATQGVSVSG